MVEIDGSYGEGGGQVLRTALSLSGLLQKPFRIVNIRKGRKRAGLMPQHLMCVQALKEITRATVQGDCKGSTELDFRPTDIHAGDYSFDIGTAGSVSLLLQALCPPLLRANRNSSLTVKGGTHVPFSPPFHYISEVFLPMIRKLGIRMDSNIIKYGFYPKGGGIITVAITPQDEIRGMEFVTRNAERGITGVSGVGNLDERIAERQRDAAHEFLSGHGIQSKIESVSVPAAGQGTFLFLKLDTAQTLAGFSSLGERRKRAETVGQEAAQKLMGHLSTEACMDPYLADQIVLYLALAKGESALTTSRITRHLLTNLWVLEQFLGTHYTLIGKIGEAGMVKIRGIG
jgi:RNA 3'-terminal phosphate cyclase (ATP)